MSKDTYNKKAYFVGSLSAKFDDPKVAIVYESIANYLRESGYEVDDAVNKTAPNDQWNKSLKEQEHDFSKVLQKIRNCDIFVAEETKISTSIGYEIGYAIANFKPCIVLKHESREGIGLALRANTSKLLNVIEYNEKNLKSKLKRVLRRAEKGIFVKRVPIEFTKTQVEYIEYRQQIPWFKSFNATVRQLVEECLNKDTKYLEMRSSDEDTDQD